jgi:AraC family transcriptional regulator of adaptative response/methylated-DNA-[protein]-cysteine methyltransferase
MVGVSPRGYADARRLEVKTGFAEGSRVTDAMIDGYGSSSRFERGREARVRGQAARRGHRHRVPIATPPRTGLVAATPRGVCAVSMGSSDAVLERALKVEYPAATLQPADRGLEKWARQIVRHLEGRRPRLDLPLDVQATAFQWQVWSALGAIPYGETRTYKEVAASIGRPSAVRAVAHACASNPVAVAIPCHRVVRTGGGMGGYRWGLPRKKALLAAEHKMKD